MSIALVLCISVLKPLSLTNRNTPAWPKSGWLASVPRIRKLIDTGMLGALGPVITTFSIWMRARPVDAEFVPQHSCADRLEARSVVAAASPAAAAVPLMQGAVSGPTVAGAAGELTV